MNSFSRLLSFPFETGAIGSNSFAGFTIVILDPNLTYGEWVSAFYRDVWEPFSVEGAKESPLL